MDQPVVLNPPAQTSIEDGEQDLTPIIPLPTSQAAASEALKELSDPDQIPTLNEDPLKLSPSQYLANLSAMDNSREPSAETEDEGLDPIELQKYKDLRTGLCYDARMRFHVEIVVDDKNKNWHPEDPRRIIAIFGLLGENGLVENSPYCEAKDVVSRPLQRIESRYATKEECCRVHTERHFEELKQTAQADDETLYKKSIDGDSVYYNQSTYSSALLAAGSAINTTLAVVREEVKNAIAVIRPPGHHSESDSSQGFCHFDNVAVAVRNAQNEVPSVKKVMIVDWDVHHGNGIQEAFEKDPNVLYISLHVYNNGTFYPGTEAGAIDRDGIGPGKGMNINIGWEDHGRTDGDYLLAFRQIIMPVANEFNPDLVMIASGFDAAAGDQLGGCFISPEGYSQMTHMLMSLANGKVVVCLEGGYNLRSISVSALAVTKTLMGQPPSRVSDALPTASGAKTVFDVIHHHQQHWKSLMPRDRSIDFQGVAHATKLHDVVRCAQAEELFKQYRMYSLPVGRDKDQTSASKTFNYQILASHNFRNAAELLLIFHEQPQLVGAGDPVSGEFSLSSPRLVDSVMPFVHWGVGNSFGVIDINLPDFYTGLSKDTGDDKVQHNRQVAIAQMQIVATFVWDNYVASASARKVVMLGVGNAFLAVQRIIATHSIEAFTKQAVKAVGIINGEVPGAYVEPHLGSYEYYYPLWTKIWVPKTNKIFNDQRNNRPRKKYGTIVPSDHESMNDLLTVHSKEIKSEILQHFELPEEVTLTEASDEEVNGFDKSGSDSSGKSALGKRARDGEDLASRIVRPRANEET